MKILFTAALVVQVYILLNAFVTFCASVCELYFESEEQIICMTKDNANTSVYEKIYKKLRSNCYGYQVNHHDLPRQRHLLSVDCNLVPRVFEGIAIADSQTFTTGHQNPNPILQNYTFNGMCNVHTVVLSSANLHILEPYAFHCAKRIRLLELSTNMIEDLPSTIFKDMPQLMYLNLSSNSIKSLHQGLFDGAPNLEMIDLSSNSIAELPDGIFQKLHNFKGAILEKNKLENLGRYPFANLTKTQGLNLSYNRLKTLENVFWQNYQLLSVVARNNEIESISKNVFAETINLGILELPNNRLKKITPEMFGSLPFLMRLALAFNQISELEGGSFLNNNFLTYLDLQGNKLTEISSGNFRGLQSLDTLVLNSNSITSIAPDSLKDMPNLRELELGSNLLFSLSTSVPYKGIFSDTRIQKLDLSGNKLASLSNVFHNSSITHLILDRNAELILSDDTFAGLIHLQMLHMKECNITSLPDGIFAHTPQLNFILLLKNRISSITVETFASLKILTLDLSYNDIESLTNRTYAKTRGLDFLNISHNHVSNMEKDTFLGTKLKGLDVNSNFLQDFTINAPDMYFLNISFNNITSLRSIFAATEKLEILDITHNNLTDITEEQWRRIFHMQLFNASNNSIREVFGWEVSHVETLPIIQLQHNKIKKIHIPDKIEGRIEDGSVFRKRTIDPNILLKIFLADNPIKCDCSAYKLYDYVIYFNRTQNYVSFEGDLLCDQPLQLQGKKLKDLVSTDMVCNYVDDCTYFQSNPPAYDCMENCSCVYQSHDEFRIVNCSNRNFENLPINVPGHTKLLDLSHNDITSIVELNQPLWEDLTEIYLESNEIDSSVFHIPKNVTYLGLKNNRLKSFPISVQKHAEEKDTFKVTLSGNLWPCDCTTVPLKDFLLAHENKVIDVNELVCVFENGSIANMTQVTYADLCSSVTDTVLPIVVYVIGAFIILASIASVVFYYKYKLYVLSFLYTYCNGFYRLFCCDKQLTDKKKFDGFIAYGSEDRDVALAIIEELEQKPPEYQFCIHERNWMPGSLILNNIQYSVENSRKTLIVLSETFVSSPWFYKEFQIAYNRTLLDKQDRLILILKGKLPKSVELPDDVKYVLNTKTYLEWGEKWFFEKLRFAMHQQKLFVREKKSSNFASAVNCFQWKEHKPTQESIEL